MLLATLSLEFNIGNALRVSLHPAFPLVLKLIAAAGVEP
jgi:hypothetical protein